jgi:hypothetical protein
MQRSRRMLVAAIATATLSLGVGQLPAAAEHGAASTPTVTAGSARAPAQKAGSDGAARFTSAAACTAPAAGKYACVQVTRSHAGGTRPGGDLSIQAVQPIPTWCNNGGIWGTRTQACEVFGVTYNTYVTSNGVTTQTGSLSSNAWGYSYSSPDLPNWAHQFSIASYTG